MPAKKTITTIGLIILFLSLGVGAYFVYQKGLLTTQVDDSIKPTKVRITNINSDSFTVSWVTQTAAQGSIAYAQDSSKLDQIALDDRDQLTGQSNTYFTHHVTLRNLKASTQYQFKLKSGEKNILFDNEGKNFFQKTAPNLGTTPATDMINGKILTSEGAAADNAIVYINLPGVTPLSTLTKKDGSWLVNLASARNSQLTNYASYDAENSIIDIYVQGKNTNSSGKTITASKSPVPDITLGGSFDYSVEEIAQTIPETPIIEKNIGMGQESTDSADLELEEEEEASSSGKELESFPVLSDEDVQIDIPAYDGEEIDDTNLTFTGTGSPSTVITVEIDGVNQGSPISVDSNGDWEFTPDDDLAEGDHVLTLTYVNGDGDETTVEREFSVVLGAMTSGTSGTPKAEASKSATPKPTVKPTPTPKPTSYATRSSMPSTTSGTPTSGVNFPTLILLILGASSLVLGLQYKKIFS